MSKLLLAISLLASVFAPQPLNAANAKRGPKFNTPIELMARVGVAYNLDLRSLLKTPGTPPYEWVAKDLPTGIVLDKPGNRLTGTPTALGTFNIQLIVQDSSGEGGDIQNGKFSVLPPAPEWTQEVLDLGLQNERLAWSFDLKTLLKDPGVVTEYSATGLPKWMQIDKAKGILSGTPQRADVGVYSGIAITASGGGGSAKITAHGEVRKVVQPPQWTKKQIALPDTLEEQAFQFDATQYVSNPEGARLAYNLVSMTPPAWMKVGKDSGTLFGTPSKDQTYQVNVSLSATIDGFNYDDTATFTIKVVNVNKPPRWKANPIQLGKAFTGVVFEQPLAGSAEDLDEGDVLTYSISGPAWAKIDSKSGVFSGTPGKSDIGTAVKFTATVTDLAGAAAQTTLIIDVIKSNEPPTWNNHPTILSEALENRNYETDLTVLATDPDRDKLFFKKLDDTALWISVSQNGTLVGTPKTSDIGLHKFRVSVTDNIAGSDIAEIHVLVKNVNDPPEWIINPIQFTVDEDSTVSKEVAQYAKDPDEGDSLQFSVFSGPSWVTVSSAGVISGVPRTDNVGSNEVIVRAMDKDGLYADVQVLITVKAVNHAPYWTTNPVVLPDATEDTAYQVSLREFAKDQDKNDLLAFYKLVEYPKWLTLSEDGNLTGTPKRGDVGANNFEVRVMDRLKADAVATVKIVVNRLNHPPRWRQNPVLLADTYEDTTYRFDLKPFAVDDDGDALKFEKVSGPEWLFVGEDGSVTGLAPNKTAGDYTAEFRVVDPGGLDAVAAGKLVVIHKNHPPTIDVGMPLLTVKERDTLDVDLTPYVKDIDDDVVKFQLLDNASWVTLSTEGRLIAKPLRAQLGDHAFNFKVDDGQLMAPGTLRIRVQKNPRPPQWLFDPIATFEAKTNMAFAETVRDRAKDLDGEPLRFSKKAGPAWMNVTSDGLLRGIARDADLGENKFTLAVCNITLCAEGTLVVNVKPGLTLETFAIDTAHPGAPAELLWVIDNSDKCDKTVKAMKTNIGVFFDELKKGGIQHSGVVISSDVKAFNALPIADKNSDVIMKWDDLNWIVDFRHRIDLAYSSGMCSNCNNSPVWAKYRFYEQVPNLNEVYHQGYITPQVPVDTMIVTHQMDHYKYYTKGLGAPLNSYMVKDFAKDFDAFHKKEQKVYRVSTIAPECPALLEESGNAASAPEPNAYRVLVDKTGGKYYTSGCNFDVNAVLRDYAQKVTWRAYVHANKTVKLSKPPMDLKSIKVTLGGVELLGNTGSSLDKWTYDSGKNEINLNWSLIDEGQLKPGDKITVEYRIS